MLETIGIGFVLDCLDPEALAPFWAAALDYANAGAVDNYVLLTPGFGDAPKLLLQKVADKKVAKNRMHLDIQTNDIETTSARLLELGAQRIGTRTEHGCNWIVMSDPEGNEFCVCDSGATGF